MTWFLASLFAVMMWSASNHIDKHLVSRYFQGGQIGALSIFASMVCLFIPLGIFIAFPTLIFSLSFQHILTLVGGGILLSLYLLPYFYTLKEEDTSLAIPFYQTIPVFGYLLGFFFLGEILTGKEILAGLLIIAGAVFLSIDIRGKVTFKMRTCLLMLLSSGIYAFSIFLFKWVAINENFWASCFWESLGVSLFGIILFFIPAYRRQFLNVFSSGSKSFVPILVLNEALNIGAKLLTNFATLLAPIVFVNLVAGIQPFFVFLYGVVLTKLFPTAIHEDISRKTIIQKCIAMIVIFIGTFLLV
jgi:drug/metabolite transporter (DMT)-like permease